MCSRCRERERMASYGHAVEVVVWLFPSSYVSVYYPESAIGGRVQNGIDPIV